MSYVPFILLAFFLALSAVYSLFGVYQAFQDGSDGLEQRYIAFVLALGFLLLAVK